MSPRQAPWLALAVVGLLGALGWATDALGPSRPPDADRNAKGERTDLTSQKHYVTPQQVVASNAMIRRSIEDFEARAHDGRRLDWATLSCGRPVVLVFVKRGCPCNVEFEPFFQRVERLYRDSVRFANVIDGDQEAARQYARDRNTPYPVLADPDLTLIHRFHAENGGYLVLVTPDGIIEGYWPGCSAESMQDLARRIARLAAVAERELDVAGMPGPLTTGCPFSLSGS